MLKKIVIILAFVLGIILYSGCEELYSPDHYPTLTELELTAPTLSTPPNNVTNVEINPTLSWTVTTAATSYTLQVSDYSSFSSFVYNQSGLKNKSQQVSGLGGSTTYYWRVNKTNSYGTSDWSSVWLFKTIGAAPSVPTLSFPINNATNVEITPVLSWVSTTGASSYTLQVSTSSTFSSFIYNQSGLTNTNQQMSGLIGSTTYYWRVNSTNSYGTSVWSSVWSFKTIGTAPAAPTLSLPANMATNVTIAPTLSWKASTGICLYTLQVSTDNIFSNYIYNQNLLSGTSQQINGLSPSTNYYWRVNVANNYGTSGWSDIWSFQTISLVPDIPTLSSPAYNATNIAIPPTLSWSSTTGLSYTLQVSTSSSFSSFIYNQSGLTYKSQQINGLSGSTTYYWRVNATNSYGTSGWSSVWFFKTIGIVPDVPALSAPANNTLDIAIQPTLYWSASSGATSYTMQVSTSSSFSSFIYNQSGLTNTSQQVSGLSNSTMYYWRVNASNSYGTSVWSSVWSFKTIGSAPYAPMLSSPANNATNVTISPTFSWNATAQASSYSLQLSTSSSFSIIFYSKGGITITSQQIIGLGNSTTYYWRVNATNTYGSSAWSSVWTFKTK